MRTSIRRMLVYGLSVSLLSLCFSLTAAQEPIRVAILPFTNATEGKDTEYWRTSLPKMLEMQLKPARGLWVVHESSISYALRPATISTNKAFGKAQAEKIGSAVEAKYVVWGDYTIEHGNWIVHGSLLRLGDGREVEKWSSAATNWMELGRQVATNIAFRITPRLTDEDREAVGRALAGSAAAFEISIRAGAAFEQGTTLATLEEEIKSAIVLEPDLSLAWLTYGTALGMQGHLEEATRAAKQAVFKDPKNSRAHFLLGSLYSLRDMLRLAHSEFESGIRLDPRDPDNYTRLGELSMKQEEWSECAEYLKKAKSLAPYSPQIRAELAGAFAHLGKTREAWEELKAAEKFIGPDFADYHLLGAVYEQMGYVPEAINHYDQRLTKVQKGGRVAPESQKLGAHLRALRASVGPTYIDAKEPRKLATQELQQAIKSKLSEQEYLKVQNPLLWTPEMKAWAEAVTRGSATEMEKAQKLFTGVTQHVDSAGDDGLRTGVEAFADLAKKGERFTCQEYSFLYIALARSINLRAYYCYVEKDFQNLGVIPACPCVFFDGKALLVDPAYRWFGVPHKQFKLVDDFEVAGLLLAQSPEISCNEIGTKLLPGSAFAWFNLAIKRADDKNFALAHEALQRGLNIEQGTWLAFYTKGYVDLSEGKYGTAILEFRKALAQNLNFAQANYFLAGALLEEGKLEEARTYLRKACEGTLPKDLDQSARSLLLRINDSL